MLRRERGVVGALSMLGVAVLFASCHDPECGDYSPSFGGDGQTEAGRSSEGGDGGAGLGGVGGISGGAASSQGGADAHAEAGQSGSGGSADSSMCAGGQPNWWNSETKSCQACPVMASVQCDEIVAGASYDVKSCTLTVQLPAGRAEVVDATLGVTFEYANNDPEQYADVKATITGDRLEFDFSPYGCSQISSLSAEPALIDACGDNVNVRAPGFGFGPAIMVRFASDQGMGGAAGAGGATNAPAPQIDCGKTN